MECEERVVKPHVVSGWLRLSRKLGSRSKIQEATQGEALAKCRTPRGTWQVPLLEPRPLNQSRGLASSSSAASASGNKPFFSPPRTPISAKVAQDGILFIHCTPRLRSRLIQASRHQRALAKRGAPGCWGLGGLGKGSCQSVEAWLRFPRVGSAIYPGPSASARSSPNLPDALASASSTACRDSARRNGAVRGR